MNAEGGLIFLLGLMFAVPLLLGLLHLLNRLAGRTLIPLWLPIGLLLVAPVAGSIYLDVAGEVRTLRVTDKRETIQYSQQFYRTGYWSRHFSVQVEHPWADTTLMPYLSLGADAATFDALRVGQTTRVRVLELGPLFKFGRLANRSTFSMIANLFPRGPRGPWHQATATVQQITNFTEDVVRKPHSRTPLPWPYQIVRLSFTPPGREQPIEFMDNIEIASMPGLAEHAVVQITWPKDDPRSARIVGARPGAPWANWFYVFGQSLAIVAAVIGLLASWAFIRRRRKKAVNNPRMTN